MTVFFKAVALFAISDKISRKSEFQFSALVGTTTKSDVHVTDVIDLRTDSNNNVDFEYLRKRLSLLLAVSNTAQLVGLYSTTETDFHPIISQFQNEEQSTPAICVTTTSEITQLKCIDTLSNEQLPVIIRPGETEEIATSTVHNHANYTQEEPDFAQNGEESLLLSLSQLETRVRKILASSTVSAETDRTLVYLANLVANYKPNEQLDNYELLTSQLSLLTNQLAAINGANNQIVRHIISLLTKTYYGA